MDNRRQIVAEHEENGELNCSNKLHIPIDLIAEILPRLPIKSIGRFMLVSKSWRDTITSRLFSFMYAKIKNNPSYVFFGASALDRCKSLMVEVSENGDSTNSVKIDFQRRLCDSGSHTIVAGSCNGLLCLVEYRSGFDKISILNPITDETTRVNYSNYDIRRRKAHYRFGYDPSTNEYKVFRCFTTNSTREFLVACGILTVGVDRRWRNLPRDMFPLYMRQEDSCSPVLPSCNGALHWLASSSYYTDDGDPCYNFILAFDIMNENTRRIPVPQANLRHLRFLVSDDPLCLYYRIGQANRIWKKEHDDGDGWGQIEVPTSAFAPYVNKTFNVDFVTSLDCAAKCGGIHFRVRGSDTVSLCCPGSKRYTEIRLRHHDLVELKNGETYNGHLVNCDTWMNIHLREVICTSKDGDRFWPMAECYIRGNTIKYLRVPDEVIDKVQEDAKSRSDRKPPGVGRGRGRGRDDSAKGIGGRGSDDGAGRGRGGFGSGGRAGGNNHSSP